MLGDIRESNPPSPGPQPGVSPLKLLSQCGKKDSNLRHLAPKASILPTELFPRNPTSSCMEEHAAGTRAVALFCTLDGWLRRPNAETFRLDFSCRIVDSNHLRNYPLDLQSSPLPVTGYSGILKKYHRLRHVVFFNHFRRFKGMPSMVLASVYPFYFRNGGIEPRTGHHRNLGQRAESNCLSGTYWE